MRKGMRSSIINVKQCFNLDLQIFMFICIAKFHNLQHRLDLHISYRYEVLCFEGRSWWHKQTKIITLNWFENELRMITTKISPQNYRNLYCLHQQCNFLPFSLLLNTKAISIMKRQIILLSLFGRFF